MTVISYPKCEINGGFKITIINSLQNKTLNKITKKEELDNVR